MFENWQIRPCLRHLSKQVCAGAGAFKSKETRLCERNGNTFALSSYCIYPCSFFHFIVNEIWRNKTKNCPRRLTAVDIVLGSLSAVGRRQRTFEISGCFEKGLFLRISQGNISNFNWRTHL